MNIGFFGMPGSGKTTQAKILADEFQLSFVGVGDSLREKAQEDFPGREALAEALKNGQMAPDFLVGQVIREKYEKGLQGNGVVLDGYPRRFSQLQYFEPDFDKVLFLQIPRDEAKKRLLERGRIDDQEEVIEERFQIYEQETLPLIDYYDQKAILVRVDGSGSIEEVAQRIRKVIQDERNQG